MGTLVKPHHNLIPGRTGIFEHQKHLISCYEVDMLETVVNGIADLATVLGNISIFPLRTHRVSNASVNWSPTERITSYEVSLDHSKRTVGIKDSAQDETVEVQAINLTESLTQTKHQVFLSPHAK